MRIEWPSGSVPARSIAAVKRKVGEAVQKMRRGMLGHRFCDSCRELRNIRPSSLHQSQHIVHFGRCVASVGSTHEKGIAI
jgi:hypothetical protein